MTEAMSGRETGETKRKATMTKYIAPLTVLAALAIAGCGGSGTVKVVGKDRAKAEAIVKTCLTKSHSPKGFTNCVAPKGHEAALEACALKAITHSIRKSTLESKLADCVVNNR